MGISVDRTFCFHPVTKEKIYFFADGPHLLKLIRNWLIDTGYILKNGKLVVVAPIKRLIDTANTEISSCHKLTNQHLNCEKTMRQNVGLACQLLSNTTATALKRYFPGDELAENVAEFIELVSSWFDTMNSYTPFPSIPTKLPFGKNFDQQNDILNKIIDSFSTMRCVSKTSMQTFQKGVIISSKSLQQLYEDMKQKHKIFFILTHRLNQDCLENFFSQVIF